LLATVSSRELAEWHAFDLLTADPLAEAPAAPVMPSRPTADDLRRKLDRAFPLDARPRAGRRG
jgi:hypothetical protein